MRAALLRHRAFRYAHLLYLPGMLTAVLCVAVSAGLLPGGPEQALAEESIREVPPWVSFMSGQVEQSDDGGVTWATPALQSRMSRGSLLKTGGDGTCVLAFQDDTLVAVNPESTIQILPPAQELRLTVVAGEAWIRFTYVVTNDRCGVSLPQSTVLALSTGDYAFSATKSTSVARVFEGAVVVLARVGGEPVRLSSGQTLTAGAGGLQPKGGFDAGAERAAWAPLLGRAGVVATTTTMATITTDLPPDGPLQYPWPVFGLLAILGGAAVGIIAIVVVLVNVLVRRTRKGPRSAR